MTFRLLSDLHYEMYYPGCSDTPPNIPTQKDSVLILAGDIYPASQRKEFTRYLEYLSGKAELVLFVPGNHEFYCEDRHLPMRFLEESMISACREVAASRITYMDKMELDVNGVRYLGATLWTNIPYGLHDMALSHMNDYSRIWSSPLKNITPNEITALHVRDREWLRMRVRKAEIERMDKVVIVTHHVPEFRLPTKTERSSDAGIGRFYYNTDMKPVIDSKTVVAWCCGHDHVSRFERPLGLDGKTDLTAPVFISNALGYPGVYNPRFNPGAIYKIGD